MCSRRGDSLCLPCVIVGFRTSGHVKVLAISFPLCLASPFHTSMCVTMLICCDVGSKTAEFA